MRPEPADLIVRDALTAATRRLAPASATPRLDAELLMAHALGVERDRVILDHLDAAAPAAFDALVARRLAGEPIAYIVGRRAFWTIELVVGPGVLIPRPDSETLIEAAVAHFGIGAPRRILDLGTGPGTLLLAALDQWPRATGLGVDASPEALAFARRNADLLGLGERADWRVGDWTEGVDGPFDLILCNPPYVETSADLPRDVAEWEPHRALFSGADGLDDYRRLAPLIPPLLASGGIACIELGAGQAEAVMRLFARPGLRLALRSDLGGHRRCLTVTA